MERDITLAQAASAFRVLLHSLATLKETLSKNGARKLEKKKRIEYQREQVEEVQNFIRLWNHISVIRKGSLMKP